MNKIKIKNLQKKIKINQKKIKNLASRVLRQEKVKRKEVSILFVCDKEIKALNKKYLKKNKPTDVLAFRMADGKFARINPQILGDVVISVQTAKKYAQKTKTPFEKELNLYLVHGLLHLLGYADTTRNGFLKMQKRQKEILENYA